MNEAKKGRALGSVLLRDAHVAGRFVSKVGHTPRWRESQRIRAQRALNRIIALADSVLIRGNEELQ